MDNNGNKKGKESSYLLDIAEPEDVDQRPTVPQGCSFCGVVMTVFLNLLFALFPLLFSFYTVQPQEEVLILFWGRLHSVVKSSGIHWYNMVGRTIIRMSTKMQTVDIKKTTVVDANGNPIIVSGVVTFKIVDTVKAAFDVQNVNDYMERQAMATLKKVCSKYPYESKDGVSLQTEANSVAKEMVAALQLKAKLCGVRVLSYELADLQYAPEIAQGMLVRQQAQALLDARKVVVEGAVTIVTTAMHSLAENGIKLSDRELNRLVSNLLSVICSDARVQPMFSISENVENESANAATQVEMLKQLQLLNVNMRPKG